MIPPVWLPLLAQLNGGLPPGVRIPDGTPGIRDVDAPCTDFEPAGKAYEDGPGTGRCETDGHYICRECVHISLPALRRRKEQCEDCGTALVTTRVSGEHCPVCDAERVLREEARERERQAAREKSMAASAEARRAREDAQRAWEELVT